MTFEIPAFKAVDVDENSEGAAGFGSTTNVASSVVYSILSHEPEEYQISSLSIARDPD